VLKYELHALANAAPLPSLPSSTSTSASASTSSVTSSSSGMDLSSAHCLLRGPLEIGRHVAGAYAPHLPLPSTSTSSSTSSSSSSSGDTIQRTLGLWVWRHKTAPPQGDEGRAKSR
jgi:hypothetical protein